MTSPTGPQARPAARTGHPSGWSRRALLAGGVLGGAALAVGGMSELSERLTSGADPGGIGGWDGVPDRPGCTDASTLLRAPAVGGATLVYEVSGKPAPLRFEPGFHAQLTRWLDDWNATSRLGGVQDLWSYGAHVNKDGCRSWHAAGRAFDISRLRAGSRVLVSCRTDLWDEVSPARRAELARGYWALAASLHLHFAHVLTHHFDGLHANHIHVDNGASGSSLSRFRTGSRVQNQAVQAICQTLWGRPGEVTGDWSDTRTQVVPVLDELGLSSSLTRQESWQGFLRASVARV